MGPRRLRKYCVLTPECEKIMENAVTKLGFSARGYDRILKRIRTTRCWASPQPAEPIMVLVGTDCGRGRYGKRLEVSEFLGAKSDSSYLKPKTSKMLLFDHGAKSW